MAKTTMKPNTYKSTAQRLLLEHVAKTSESISSIARATGLRLFALQKIQKGVSASVKPGTAAKLAQHFGCTTEEVLGRPVKPSGESFPTQISGALAPASTSGVGPADAGRHSPPGSKPNSMAVDNAEQLSRAEFQVAADADGRTAGIPWNKLVRSDLNPRQADNSAESKEKMQELADDLHENGQIQNLLVRPHKTKDGYFEVVAGDRRYRAFGLNIKAGRRTADDPMRCQIRQLEDNQARAIAIVENLQRQNLTATEEGNAFVALLDLGWETRDLSERIHKSLTYVQQRITLVRRAVPELCKALNKGELTFDAARTLAAGKPEEQTRIIAAIRSNDYRYRNADMIRQELTRDLVPASFALFPLADYQGEKRDVDGATWLADRNAFNALQDGAVKAKKQELLDAGWSWVTVAEFIHRADYEAELSTAKKKAGCMIVHAHNGSVEIFEGLVEKVAAAASGALGQAQNRREAEDQYEKQVKAGQRFIAGLAEYLATRPALALRLYVYQGEMERALAPTFEDGPIIPWAEIAAASEKQLGKIVMKQIGMHPTAPADQAMLDLAKKAGIKVPAHMQPKQNGSAGASGVGGAAASARASSKNEARA